MIDLHKGNCLDVMPLIPDKSVDMILCDLPYGTTACKWDIIIPFSPLWEQYERVIKDNGAIVLTASQPFTSLLVMSNLKYFRYSLVWDKVIGTNFQLANLRPMSSHEDILVFSKGKTANGSDNNMCYYPQMTMREKPIKGGGMTVKGALNNHNMVAMKKVYNDKHPISILTYRKEINGINKLHTSQKPILLMEYLIKSYTKEGETILDNCMGSGTTGVACYNTNRNFIGIEKDEKYFDIAEKRIAELKYKFNFGN